MPKPLLIIVAVGAVAVIGGAAFVMTKEDKPAASSNDTNTSQSTNDTAEEVAVSDPDGVYKLFSDPSVTVYPEAGALFGNGQVLTFEYDGSKTMNDEYATLSYQLYYIDDNGSVQPMGGGNLEGKGSGTFTTAAEDKVFNSSAKDKEGFFELIGTYTTGTEGTNVPLGMYSIKFDVSE